jgi:ankyrin repeat protein
MSAMIFNRDFDVVEFLLDAKADPRQESTDPDMAGFNALFGAACMGLSRNVGLWLDKFPAWDLALQDGRSGSAALGGCCLNSVSESRRIIQDLLHRRADVNAPNFLGSTALHCVCTSETSNPQALKLLLEHRADPNLPSIPTTTAFRAIFAVARVAVHAGSGDGLLKEFAQCGGWTPLMVAAARGKVVDMAILLDARADPSLLNWQGRTALEIAAASYGGKAPEAIEDFLAVHQSTDSTRVSDFAKATLACWQGFDSEQLVAVEGNSLEVSGSSGRLFFEI